MSKINPKHVYFLGIGGIGMSALARYFNERGISVSGYDLRESELTRTLEAEGISIHYQDLPDQILAEIDYAIYTPAVPADLAELIALQSRGIPLVKRAEALGLISQKHKTLAVAGTHGKTTMSAMAAYLMRELDTDAVGFLGGISSNYKTNYLAGKGEWLVVEADEFDRSFLHLSPDVAIISFIDPDHLDIYKEQAAFEASFREFTSQISEQGILITKPDIADKIKKDFRGKEIITYGYNDPKADWNATDICVKDGAFQFSLHAPQGKFDNIRVQMPGAHNIENILAAIISVYATGQKLENILKKIKDFKGVVRRYERIGKIGNAIAISDYAHHPTEIKACIEATKLLFKDYRIIAIFQPHLYSRTRDFAEEFARELSKMEEVILLELYPAREKPIPGITSLTIFYNISSNTKYLTPNSELSELLKILDGDVLLFMGAGNIDELARRLSTASDFN